MRVTSSTLRDVPVAMERAPAREPVVESPKPQPTLADGSDQIPTLATSAIPPPDIRRQRIPTQALESEING